MRLLSLVVLCAVLSVGCNHRKADPINFPTPNFEVKPDPYDQAVAKKAKRYFTKKFKKRRFNGVVLLAENGRILYEESFGVANKKTNDSLDANSMFQLASISKPITAVAVLQLIEQGKISVSDSIQKFLPDFPYKGIDIEMLLTHKSGLFNYMYFADVKWSKKGGAISNDQVLDLINKYEPAPYLKPNTKYNYSNTNYLLLACIVEKVTGIKFGDYLKTHVFEPAGMNRSVLYSEALNPEIRDTCVQGYRPNGRPAENSYLNGVVGDKNVYSSSRDLLKLDQALRHGEIVGLELQHAAYLPRHKRMHAHDNYGLGWRVDVSDPNNQVVFHSGWWKGFKSCYVRELGTGRTIIVLTNYLQGFLKIAEIRKLYDVKI